MQVVDYQKLIKESVKELRSLEKQQSNARLLLRLQLLRLLKSGEFTQAKKASEFLGISPKHGYDLLKRYREQKLVGFLQLDYKPGQSKLSKDQEARLLKRSEKGFGSQKEAIEYIEAEFGVKYAQQGISDLFKRLGIKSKVARPFNIKANPEEQVEYKKTLLS